MKIVNCDNGLSSALLGAGKREAEERTAEERRERRQQRTRRAEKRQANRSCHEGERREGEGGRGHGDNVNITKKRGGEDREKPGEEKSPGQWCDLLSTICRRVSTPPSTLATRKNPYLPL